MKRDTAAWPVLKRYDADHLLRIAMPLGGIGTGTVSLGGRGDLRDWEVMNRPGKGYIPRPSGLGSVGPFFALYAKAAGRPAVARLLEGPLDPTEYEGGFGARVTNHGLPRFASCEFAAAYPLGQVRLADPDVPVSVRLEAFNPFIPCDAERSGLPVAVLRFVLHNRTRSRVTATVCGNLPNFIGADGSQTRPAWQNREVTGAKANHNEFRRRRGLAGIFFSSTAVPLTDPAWGTMALATTATADLSHRTAWAKLSWGDSLLDFWDDFNADGAVEERDAADAESPMASLAARVVLPPGGSTGVTFLITWHFPNRYTWTPAPAPAPAGDAACDCAAGACGTPKAAANPDCIGNYYTTRFRDAWDAAGRIAPQLAALERDTVRFVRAFCDADLPEVLKEAALFNVSTLRTQTCFRTPDGRFFGWEGCGDNSGCCHGSCTHVWNYELALPHLFGDLARAMREVEFAHCTAENGLMSFRVNLPLSRATGHHVAAADGQMGCIMKMHRDWQLSGQDGWLRALWPKVRKAVEFCWIEGGWDGDRDGVMEGCQHNTMDVEYYGPNPQMGGWYLGALRAAEEMARHLGDAEFADLCRRRFEYGRTWIDAHLFNGEFYEHEIRPPGRTGKVADGLRAGMGAADPDHPILQLGAGCLVDQLVGQYMAHACNLGYLLNPAHVRRTLRSVMKYNFRTDFNRHFNHLRSFVLGQEAALLMATYPKGRRPARPFPYYNEVMTGFEYAAAVHMLYEGQIAAGLKVIGAIRARYDGRKRSPFDEAECGHHYARAMASWGAVLALTGFRYSAVTQSMQFAAVPGGACWFWSTGDAWGTFTQKAVAGGSRAELRVLGAARPFRLRELTLAGYGKADLDSRRRLPAGTVLRVFVRAAPPAAPARLTRRGTRGGARHRR